MFEVEQTFLFTNFYFNSINSKIHLSFFSSNLSIHSFTAFTRPFFLTGMIVLCHYVSYVKKENPCLFFTLVSRSYFIFFCFWNLFIPFHLFLEPLIHFHLFLEPVTNSFFVCFQTLLNSFHLFLEPAHFLPSVSSTYSFPSIYFQNLLISFYLFLEPAHFLLSVSRNFPFLLLPKLNYSCF